MLKKYLKVPCFSNLIFCNSLNPLVMIPNFTRSFKLFKSFSAPGKKVQISAIALKKALLISCAGNAELLFPGLKANDFVIHLEVIFPILIIDPKRFIDLLVTL